MMTLVGLSDPSAGPDKMLMVITNAFKHIFVFVSPKKGISPL